MFSAVCRHGGMAEWSMAAVLKTVRGATSSWVRILLPPPQIIVNALLSYIYKANICLPIVLPHIILLLVPPKKADFPAS
jgi:hypothetical protein